MEPEKRRILQPCDFWFQASSKPPFSDSMSLSQVQSLSYLAVTTLDTLVLIGDTDDLLQFLPHQKHLFCLKMEKHVEPMDVSTLFLNLPNMNLPQQ